MQQLGWQLESETPAAATGAYRVSAQQIWTHGHATVVILIICQQKQTLYLTRCPPVEDCY